MKPKKTSEEKFTNVPIPTSLFEKIKERIEGTEFKSVSDYLTYVIKEILTENDDEESVSEKDEKLIKERLRALGYIE